MATKIQRFFSKEKSVKAESGFKPLSQKENQAGNSPLTGIDKDGKRKAERGDPSNSYNTKPHPVGPVHHPNQV